MMNKQSRRPTSNRGQSRSGGNSHEEALPTPRLVLTDAAKVITGDILVGCGVTLGFVTFAMLVATAALPDALQPAADRVGRGIVGAAAAGILVVGLVYGYIATAARVALGAFYAGLGSKARQLRDTLIVRGQASPAPYAPASASTLILGSITVFAVLVCVILAAEHRGRLEDEVHRAEFTVWAVWAGVFAAVTACCAAAGWLFSVLNRRWRARMGSLLPKGALGDRGPSVRVTTRAQRRAQRRSWRPLDWSAWVGRLLVGVGGGIVFVGVYLHQPGLYADRITYSDKVERFIDGSTIVGGAMLGLGMLIVTGTGGLALRQTIRALRRASTHTMPISDDDQKRILAATRTLSSTAAAALVWWTVCAVAGVGWWFAHHVRTAADGTSEVVPLSVSASLLIGWAVIGLLCVGARTALEVVAPVVRNRFGYEVPSVPDDREYPDLTHFGQ